MPSKEMSPAFKTALKLVTDEITANAKRVGIPTLDYALMTLTNYALRQVAISEACEKPSPDEYHGLTLPAASEADMLEAFFKEIA